MFARYMRLHSPLVLNRVTGYSRFAKWQIRRHGISSYEILTQTYLNSSQTTPTVTRQLNLPRVALALPIEASRFGINMEGEMLFAYRNSLLSLGIEALILDPMCDLEDLDQAQSRILAQLSENGIQVLVLQGDNRLNDSPIFSAEFVAKIRNNNIAIVVDLVDVFKIYGGNSTLEFFSDRADFLICHNSRLNVDKYFVDRSLIWPSLPYPESFYIERHSPKRHGLLIPGAQHRGRQYYVKYAKKHGLDFVDSLFSRSNQTSGQYSYENYTNRLCKADMVFTNGYKNRRESQVIGRVSEVMLAKSALLYESGSDIDYFFLPYSDYIPVINLADFLDKVNYLINNPRYMDKIAYSGHVTILNKFSTSKFWSTIFKTVC
jgi:hypothetical protein